MSAASGAGYPGLGGLEPPHQGVYPPQLLPGSQAGENGLLPPPPPPPPVHMAPPAPPPHLDVTAGMMHMGVGMSVSQSQPAPLPYMDSTAMMISPGPPPPVATMVSMAAAHHHSNPPLVSDTEAYVHRHMQQQQHELQIEQQQQNEEQQRLAAAQMMHASASTVTVGQGSVSGEGTTVVHHPVAIPHHMLSASGAQVAGTPEPPSSIAPQHSTVLPEVPPPETVAPQPGYTGSGQEDGSSHAASPYHAHASHAPQEKPLTPTVQEPQPSHPSSDPGSTTANEPEQELRHLETIPPGGETQAARVDECASREGYSSEPSQQQEQLGPEVNASNADSLLVEAQVTVVAADVGDQPAAGANPTNDEH